MDELRFTVPGEARGKGRPRATARKGFVSLYTDAATVKYEKLVLTHALAVFGDRKPFDVALTMIMVVRVAPPASASKKATAEMLSGFVFPAKGFDLDNVVKAVSDAMNAKIYTDDRLIVHLVARKIYAANPGVDVLIRPAVPVGLANT